MTLLPEYLKDEQAVILLTRYQATDTNGFRLRKLSRDEYTENEKFDQKIQGIRLSDIKCKIFDLSHYSYDLCQEVLEKVFLFC
ncbi:hypothetical protein ACYULU_14785 [Breznakiellaceae bacterium SP9]